MSKAAVLLKTNLHALFEAVAVPERQQLVSSLNSRSSRVSRDALLVTSTRADSRREEEVEGLTSTEHRPGSSKLGWDRTVWPVGFWLNGNLGEKHSDF